MSIKSQQNAHYSTDVFGDIVNYMFRPVIRFDNVSNLTHFITLHSCNRNDTLKVSVLPAETCR